MSSSSPTLATAPMICVCGGLLASSATGSARALPALTQALRHPLLFVRASACATTFLSLGGCRPTTPTRGMLCLHRRLAEIVSKVSCRTCHADYRPCRWPPWHKSASRGSNAAPDTTFCDKLPGWSISERVPKCPNLHPVGPKGHYGKNRPESAQCGAGHRGSRLSVPPEADARLVLHFGPMPRQGGGASSALPSPPKEASPRRPGRQARAVGAEGEALRVRPPRDAVYRSGDEAVELKEAVRELIVELLHALVLVVRHPGIHRDLSRGVCGFAARGRSGGSRLDGLRGWPPRVGNIERRHCDGLTVVVGRQALKCHLLGTPMPVNERPGDDGRLKPLAVPRGPDLGGGMEPGKHTATMLASRPADAAAPGVTGE